MDERFTQEGLTIAPGVVEAIVSAAVAEVAGVSQVGVPTIPGGIISTFNRHYPVQGILILADEAGEFSVAVHVHLLFGSLIHEVAAEIREAVTSTLEGQVGIKVSAVDVFVDGIHFTE